ncbi:MAG: SOS response-associated peptidase [Rhodospirillaceae bacterium]|nr:MAG: SOS response-associated peptidase [Rhodospirillaceae bacterium]
MCGRYVFISNVDAIKQLFLFDNLPNLAPRYNIAPTQQIPIVRSTGDGREMVNVRWGLLPFWLKEAPKGPPVINAKAEGIEAKPMFRAAIAKRRCLVPADGFYEWKGPKDDKQPYLIRLATRTPFAFAGVWERWKSPEGEIDSAAILTCEPNSLMAEIHNRMPVILDPSEFDAWLSDKTPQAEIGGMIDPFPAEQMRAEPVSKAVNSVKNVGPECIEPLEAGAV